MREKERETVAEELYDKIIRRYEKTHSKGCGKVGARGQVLGFQNGPKGCNNLRQRGVH